jgi:hypothetical protein
MYVYDIYLHVKITQVFHSPKIILQIKFSCFFLLHSFVVLARCVGTNIDD